MNYTGYALEPTAIAAVFEASLSDTRVLRVNFLRLPEGISRPNIRSWKLDIKAGEKKAVFARR